MTDPSSNKDINVPVRRKIPRPDTSPPDMPTNCRFKSGQIVRLRSQYGAAEPDSIGIVDYYLPKNYSEEGVCWVHFYDTFYLDLMTDEEPKSPGIIEIVHQNDLELCKHLPSWLPYELDKETGGYKLDVKTEEAAIKRLNRVEKLFRDSVIFGRKVKQKLQSRRKKVNMQQFYKP
jgi:hypothetical protein